MSLTTELGDGFERTISIRNIVEITTNDGANLANATKAIYVPTTATLKVDTVGGQVGVVITGLAAGIWHPIQVKKIYATGSSISTLLGSW